MAKAIKKQALGRGLSALLNDGGETNDEQRSGAEIVSIDIENIQVNPYQPRTRFNEEALNELADSIKSLGLIQPITVRKKDQGQYELVSGERRYRASKKVGLKKIPAYVRSANDQELLEMALVENIQRQDLDPIEIALTYQRLLEDISLSVSELGQRVGKDRSTVTNYLRLLKLDPLIQSGMRDGWISMGHGRSLINVDRVEDQKAIYRDILNKNLSVRQTEDRVKALKNSDQKAKRSKRLGNSQQDKALSEFYNTSVTIKGNPKGAGNIQIKFKNQEELAALTKKLLGEK
jgi:ParB family chromosome partitioning protein